MLIKKQARCIYRLCGPFISITDVFHEGMAEENKKRDPETYNEIKGDR